VDVSVDSAGTAVKGPRIASSFVDAPGTSSPYRRGSGIGPCAVVHDPKTIAADTVMTEKLHLKCNREIKLNLADNVLVVGVMKVRRQPHQCRAQRRASPP